MTQTAPFGTWKSPITSDLIVAETIRLAEPSFDGTDIYWTELRPAEGGRIVLVKRSPDGTTSDVTPAGFNVRTRVHEYGGAAHTVHNGVVWFSNFGDQRLYRQVDGGDPKPLTPEEPLRFADMRLHPGGRFLVGVREDHTNGDREEENTLVALDAQQGGPGTVIARGCDFYSNPRVSPDGSKIAWLQWNHPNMPWDGTELYVAEWNDDRPLDGAKLVAGGAEESVLQPLWSPAGELYFISDRSGWWNLYRWEDGDLTPIHPREVEFGGPSWLFGLATYDFDSADSLVARFNQGGQANLLRIDTRTLESEASPTSYGSINSLHVQQGRALFVGGSPLRPTAIVQVDLDGGEATELRQSAQAQVDREFLSEPQAIEFPTEEGLTAHAFYYPPANGDYQAPEGEHPPLLVRSHGGPTSSASTDFSLSIQYWTSRGYAFLDVNYGGSTGYGREYRNRLRGKWGVVDVDDCIDGAKYLVKQGLADEQRVAIDGGSAGGYTTLCALTMRDYFAAGASHFGLSDLTVFVGDTHKFESRYLDSLVGPWPEAKELYEARSAINFVDQLSCPVAFFQGDEDKIVPPNQAELMVEVLRRKGLPVVYVLFEGEQHGFRKAENIKRALDGEFYFFARIFGFQPADDIEPLEIENLPE